MQKWGSLFCFCFALFQTGYCEVPLLQDYSKAQEMALTYNRPLILLFTGSDWSISSQKILRDVLTDSEFIEAVRTQFIFVQIDFPEKNYKTTSTLVQNEVLREKYGIKEFPIFVMLDTEEREITRITYLEKNPKEYASYLKDLFFTYTDIKKEMEKDLSVEEMEELYHRIATLGSSYLKEELLQRGIRCKEGVFFPLEAYAQCVKAKEHDTPSAKILRTTILERDQQNKKKGRLRLALLDFQAHQENIQDGLKYLQAYVDTFGKEDLEQLFRLHLVIADYFSQQEKDLQPCSSSK